MPGLDLLLTNLLSPIVLAFALGAVAGFIRSELELPEAVLKLISIYHCSQSASQAGANSPRFPSAMSQP